jgi:para-nitrobenzyl esterase
MNPVIHVQQGRLEGREEDGLCVFRGIPYAKPPVGALRFRPPQPPETWSGTRDAGGFGGSAPQNTMMLALPGMDVGATDEDCLSLNVWTPACDGKRRPVMFWIHGGGYVIGSGAQAVYDGAALARRGDVVVVTINYRMGPLGFLYLADLCPDYPDTGNEGTRDQVAALRWVHDNAEAFGGDPENLTIFGESAGGMSVGTILGVPSARGLFRRAIPQSGASHNFHTRETASKIAEAFLDHLGIAPADAADALPAVPVASLLDMQQQTLFKLAGRTGLLPFQPLVDGDFLPDPPLEAVRAGGARGVSLLVGTTRDEWKLLGALIEPDVPSLDDERLRQKLAGRIPGVDGDALLDIYRGAREGRFPTRAPEIFYAIETDRVFRVPAIRLTEAQAPHTEQCFMYRMDWESPLFGGLLGACHAIELPFVFGTWAMPGGEQFVGAGDAAARFCEQVMDAWLAFARTGDPAHAGLPDWPRYDAERRATMILGPESRLEDDPQTAEREAWEGVL